MKLKALEFIIYLFASAIIVSLCRWLLLQYIVDDTAVRLVKLISHSLYIFTPAFAVFIVEKWRFKSLFSDYRLTFRKINGREMAKYIIATLLIFPAFILLAVYIFGNLCGLESFGKINIYSSFDLIFKYLGVLIIGFFLKLLPLLCGELGWRGLLETYVKLGHFKKYTLIGSIWGLWSIPIILSNPRERLVDNLLAAACVIAFCIVSSFYLAKALKATKTLLTPVIINALIGVNTLALFMEFGNPHIIGVNGVIVILSIMFLNLLFTRKTI